MALCQIFGGTDRWRDGHHNLRKRERGGKMREPLPCARGTTNDYEALGSTGCVLGDKLLSSFLVQGDSSILLNVTPDVSSSLNPGLIFTGGGARSSRRPANFRRFGSSTRSSPCPQPPSSKTPVLPCTQARQTRARYRSFKASARGRGRQLPCERNAHPAHPDPQ